MRQVIYGCAGGNGSSRRRPHWVTWSTRRSSDWGIVRPRAFAVLRLIASEYRKRNGREISDPRPVGRLRRDGDRRDEHADGGGEPPTARDHSMT